MERTQTSWVVLGVLLMLGLAGCGSSGSAETTTPTLNEPVDTEIGDTVEDEAEPTTAEVAEVSLAEYCEDTAVTRMMVQAGTFGDPEDPGAWAAETVARLEADKQAAPAAIEAEVATTADLLLALIETGSDIPREEFFAAAKAAESYLAAECGWEVIEFTTTDYRFEVNVDVAESGYVFLAVENQGEEVHDLWLERIADDASETVDQIFDGEAWDLLSITVVTAPAAPGETVYAPVRLEPGRYAISCGMPVGATSMEALLSGEADGPPHFVEGMVMELTVVG